MMVFSVLLMHVCIFEFRLPLLHPTFTYFRSNFLSAIHSGQFFFLALSFSFFFNFYPLVLVSSLVCALPFFEIFGAHTKRKERWRKCYFRFVFAARSFIYKNEFVCVLVFGEWCVRVCARRKEIAIKKSRIEFDVLTDENLCAREKNEHVASIFAPVRAWLCVCVYVRRTVTDVALAENCDKYYFERKKWNVERDRVWLSTWNLQLSFFL